MNRRPQGRLVPEGEHSELAFWDTSRGWGGEGEGRGFRMVAHMCALHGWDS